MLGPAIGGALGDPKFLGDLASPQLPFIAAGLLSMLNVLFGLLVLPETLPEDERRPFSWKRSSVVGAVKSLGNVAGARGLIFVLFLLGVAHTVYPTTYTLSTQVKLGWTSGDVGLSLLAFGIASFIVQGGLIRVIIPKTGMFWAGVIGMIAAAIAYSGMGLATVGWVIYAMGPFAAFAGLYGPAVNNMMSSRLSRSEQGELQGAIGAAQGLALMIGPLMMSGTFYVFGEKGTSYYQPGAPFILAALLVVISLVIFYGLIEKSERKPSYIASTETEANID